jgi:hypothetical protein
MSAPTPFHPAPRMLEPGPAGAPPAPDDLQGIARSVLRARWAGEPEPSHSPPVETFALWVGYAKLLAAAVLISYGGRP